MLRAGAGSRRRGLGLVLTVLALVVLGLAGAPAATAIPENCTLVPDGYDATGTVKYKLVCTGGDDDGGGGGGGGGLTCELTGLATYCIGTSACWANVPSALDPATWPEETRPSPDAIYTFQSCDPDPGGTLTGWSWYVPPGPSLSELATVAYGELSAPAFSIGVSPVGRALVDVPTWFWAATDHPGELRGTSAGGVVAVATPAALEVDRGDGSANQLCAWSTAADATCSTTYARASVHGTGEVDGQPAYVVRMRLVYDVRFEYGGGVLSLPGLPDTFSSAWQQAAVPVAEIQTLVTG